MSIGDPSEDAEGRLFRHPPSTLFLRLDEEWSSFDRAKVAVLPLPYEHTTSYGMGTVHAPAAILEASYYLELYDEELDVEIFRLPEGVATLPPMRFDAACRDATAVEAIRNEVSRLIGHGKTVVSIGGEHTIAIGAAHAHAQHYPDLTILHFDAHSDLRQEYEGNRYSHGCTMARIYDFHHDIVQVGIRSQGIEESLFIKEKKITTFYAIDIRQGRYGSDQTSWHDAVIRALRKNVYVTFDCDFFDPTLIPTLGTPEPGGFGWDETVALLRRIAAERNIVGFDVNELLPVAPLFHPQFIIAKLIYKWIGYLFTSAEKLRR